MSAELAFVEDLGELCDLILRHPKSGTPMTGYPPELDVRSYPMSTFRYSLIIAITDDTPMVYAVAHQHRMPGYWRNRLK